MPGSWKQGKYKRAIMKKITFVLFAAISAAAFLLSGCSLNGSHYEATAEEVLSAALADEYLVTPEEAQNLSGEALFIDLRSPAEFARGHIDKAVNIPTQNLLEPAHRSRFNDANQTCILYGASELAANGPWMLLHQLGYENVRVLQGGYDYWSDLEASGDYLTETARFPYDSLFQLATQRTQMEEEALRAKPVVVNEAPAPKKEIVPQKKKVAVEEEEGC